MTVTFQTPQTTDTSDIMDLLLSVAHNDEWSVYPSQESYLDLWRFEARHTPLAHEVVGRIDKKIVAYAHVLVNEETSICYLDAFVAPDTPSEISAQLLDYIMPYAQKYLQIIINDVSSCRREVLREENFPQIRINPYSTDRQTESLLLYYDFDVVRKFYYMKKTLKNDLPEKISEIPHELSEKNLEIRHATTEDIVPLCYLHNEVFQDHWGHEDISPEEFTEAFRLGVFDLGLTIVVTHEKDHIVASHIGSYNAIQTGYTGVKEGYTELVSVRSDYRGYGLASTMLNYASGLFADHKMTQAGLDVDSFNPSGAVKIYEKLGYKTSDVQAVYAYS